MSKFSCPYPTLLSPLSPNGYQLIIDKLPGVNFFSQQVSIPNVSQQGQSNFSTPLSDIMVPSEKLTFDDLVCTFLVDEKMENYKSVFNWLNGFGFPESNQQYTDYINQDKTLNKSIMEKFFSPARIIIYGNNNTPIQTIEFQDLSPASLSALQFTNTASSVEYLTAEAVFNYTLFKFD